MKIARFVGLAALSALAFAAGAATVTGSGVTRTENRSVSGFHAIALGIPAEVTVRQAGSEGLTLTGDDNIVPLVETVVDNGTLKIRWAPRADSASYNKLAITIDVRTLDSIAVGGTGRVHAEKLDASSLAAKIGGTGEIAIDRLDAKSASIVLGGSGRATLAGRVDSFDVTLAGSGEASAAKLEARAVQATVQGSARATVWAKDKLRATIAGSGEVTYYGRPQVAQTIAGSGSVRNAGDAP